MSVEATFMAPPIANELSDINAKANEFSKYLPASSAAGVQVAFQDVNGTYLTPEVSTDAQPANSPSNNGGGTLPPTGNNAATAIGKYAAPLAPAAILGAAIATQPHEVPIMAQKCTDEALQGIQPLDRTEKGIVDSARAELLQHYTEKWSTASTFDLFTGVEAKRQQYENKVVEQTNSKIKEHREEIRRGLGVSVNNDEELNVVVSMYAQGKDTSQIQTALDNLRANRSDHAVPADASSGPGKPSTMPESAAKVEPANATPAEAQLTAEEIPTFKSGRFNAWFNARSPEQISKYYEDPALRSKIENGLRAEGGKHELLMVAEAPHWKRWGITAGQVQNDFAIPIRDLNAGGVAKGWQHSTGVGDRAPGSSSAHNELQRIIQRSTSLQDFKENIRPWAEKWLTGGYNALPPGFH